MAAFFGVVIALGFGVSWYYGDPTILFVAVAFSIVMNVIGYWYSDSIVLKIHGAQKVSRESHRELWNIVENLSITAGLPIPALYIIPDPAPNAFATGRDKDHAAVAVTAGLLSLLDRSELEGVLAHELSHVGNRDTLVQTIAVILVGFVALLADFFLRSSAWGMGGSRDRDSRAQGIALLIGIILAILAPIFAQLLQLAISRKREFLADASGALLTRYPEGLASALEKISRYGAPMQHVNRATAHLFIANPLGGGKKNIAKLFMTHPPVEERIAALREMG